MPHMRKEIDRIKISDASSLREDSVNVYIPQTGGHHCDFYR